MTSQPLRRALRAALVLAVLPVAAAAPAVASASTWTVDDDRAQCPNAGFTAIQDAVDQAAPHDTIVVCDGLYLEESTPAYGNAQSYAEPGSRNGLTITKPLTIRGAGADKVTIRPAPELGSSLAGTTPRLRDGGGNVITVSRQSLGSSDDNEHFVSISGVTVDSPTAYAEAGIAFFNTSGRVADSVVGPLRRTAAADVAAQPHGWGIVQTNSLQSAVQGGIRREVTVQGSLVTGFNAGGVLFDASVGGADGAATTTTRSNVNAYGHVIDSRVVGRGAGQAAPQTGVRFHAGERGSVVGSSISDTWSGVAGTGGANARASVGLLLTDAEIGADPTNPAVPALTVSGDAFRDTGYAVFNANGTNDAVRNGAPITVSDSWWGRCGGVTQTGPAAGASSYTTKCQGYSGNDAGNPAATPAVAPAPSVLVPSYQASEPTPVAAPAATADAAPTAEILEPTAGLVVPVGTEIRPVVAAADDFGVRSVRLVAGDADVATRSTRPYEFSWTPTAAQAGTTVELTATVTDSAGQTTTATVPVTVPALPAPSTPPTTPAPPMTPAPAPPASPASPGPRARVASRAVRLDGQGRFAVKVACGTGRGACRVRVLVRRGSVTLGSRTVRIAAGRSRSVLFRPNDATARSLRRGKAVTVQVGLTGLAGTEAPRTTAVKVRPKAR